MTTEQKNRYVAEKLGMCWHEWDWSGKFYYCTRCEALLKDVAVPTNPDFSRGEGVILLLKEMMKREDWWAFRNQYGDTLKWNNTKGDYESMDMIAVSYITIPGKLLDAVWEWMRKEAADAN